MNQTTHKTNKSKKKINTNTQAMVLTSSSYAPPIYYYIKMVRCAFERIIHIYIYFNIFTDKPQIINTHYF